MGGSWKFEKSRQVRPIKRVFVLAMEGQVTEPRYFSLLKSMSLKNTFDIVENLGRGSDPQKVVARMKKHLKANPLERDGQAWIVIDQPESVKKLNYF